TVRPRQSSDLDQCSAILRAVHATSGYPVEGVEDTDAILTASTCLKAWVAESAISAPKAIIGHVALSAASETDISVSLWYSQNPSEREAGRTAVLGRLFVDPAAQGAGAATKLMGAAVEEAKSQGLRLVMFALEKDAPAMRLYDRLGWRRFAEGVYEWRDQEGGERRMRAVCFV
ncbi:putative acetyltransferase, partial [Polychaeton citri CBS 116435]